MPSLQSLASLAAMLSVFVTPSVATPGDNEIFPDTDYPEVGPLVSDSPWPFAAMMERIDFIIETEYSLGGDFWEKLIHLTYPEHITTEFVCSDAAKIEEADVWQRHYIPATNISFNIHPGNWCSLVGQRHAPAADCMSCFDDLRIKLRDEEDREINIPRTTECAKGEPSAANGARNMAVRLNYTCTLGRWYKGMEPWNNADTMAFDDNGELVNPEVVIVDGPVPGQQ